MADTVRTKSAILTALQDNTSGLISPQNIRDSVVTLLSGEQPFRGHIGSPAVATYPIDLAATEAYTINGAVINLDAGTATAAVLVNGVVVGGLSSIQVTSSAAPPGSLNAVTTYGMNTGASDNTAALQSAITAATAGQIVFIPPGTYNFTGTVNLKTGVTVQGVRGSTIFHNNATANTTALVIMQTVPADRVTGFKVDGITFDGGIMQITTNDSVNFPCQGSVTNNVFQNCNDINFSKECLFIAGLDNSRIINNSFHDCLCDACIVAYDLSNTTINYNRFVNVNQGTGLHVSGTTNRDHDVTVGYNYFSNIKRIGVEWQSAGTTQTTSNMVCTGNWLSGFQASPTQGTAYSIVLDGPGSTTVSNNYAVASSAPGYGIELGGPSSVASGNYFNGFNVGIICYHNNQRVTNNNIVNYNQDVQIFGGVTGTVITGTTHNAALAVPAQPVSGPAAVMSPVTATATSANSVNIGDAVTLAVSAASSPGVLAYKLNRTII